MQIYKTIIKNSKYFKIDGSNVGKNNLFNQYMEYIVLDPTSVGPSSVLTLNQLNALKMTSSDNFYVTAASFTDTAWTSGGWDMSTDANFQAQLNTWLLANITDALYEKGLCTTIVTRGTVTSGGSTLYTLVFLYAGNVGTLVEASSPPETITLFDLFSATNTGTPVDVVSYPDIGSWAVLNTIPNFLGKEKGINKFYGWGLNNFGEVGDGTTTVRTSPVSVLGGRTFSKIVSGGFFRLAFEGTDQTAAGIFPNYYSATIEASTGYAWTWGNNSFGQLGTRTTQHSSSPVSVVSGRSFKDIATGGMGFTVALEGSTGRAWAWGCNKQLAFYVNGLNDLYTYGMCGDSATTSPTQVNRSSPVSVLGARSFSKVQCGISHVVALEASTGRAWCWGSNGMRQLGSLATADGVGSPVSVIGGRSFKDIAAGDSHNFGIEASTGRAWGWGYNGCGQLGSGTTGYAQGNNWFGGTNSSPVSVLGGRSFTKIACGGKEDMPYSHTIAIEGSTGLAWAWGSNALGELGNGETTVSAYKSSPVSVLGGRSYVDCFATATGSYAIDSTGKVWYWGEKENRTSPISLLYNVV